MKYKSCRCLFLVTVLCLLLLIPSFADETQARLPRLLDAADLLTDNEESALLSALDEVSQRQQMDLVIVAVDSTEGAAVTDYADDIYDNYGYGFGADRSGALLLLSMEERVCTFRPAVTASPRLPITESIFFWMKSRRIFPADTTTTVSTNSFPCAISISRWLVRATRSMFRLIRKEASILPFSRSWRSLRSSSVS